MSDYSGYSSHYAQAYYQSTFPPTQWQQPVQYQQQQQWRQQPQASSSRYVPQGHSRCTYKDCTFSGPPKVLETHMMDRHLIYPAWWDSKKKKPDWDADPSLKGKNRKKITILGTNLSLDNPEDLTAWIEERKKRWPTATRVEDKKRKMEEAISRGQIVPGDGGRRAKRSRTDESQTTQYQNSHRGGHRQNYTRGRGRGGVNRGQPPRQFASGYTQTISTKSQDAPSASASDEDSDDDGAPEVTTSKKEPEAAPEEEEKPNVDERQEASTTTTVKSTERPHKKMPKKEPFNPFATRPVLLHRLLLPEIRMTVSNLSQAIRFLVDNDFLEGYEESPGAANDTLIQVVDQKGEQDDKS